MATTTTLELVDYYAGLLIMQYLNKPRATPTIKTQVTPVLMPQVSLQVLTWETAPGSGTFILKYNGASSAAINWNDNAATIQGKLRAVSGLSSVVVTGAISDKKINIKFDGVTPPALLLEAGTSTLNHPFTIAETDLTLPLAVQAGYNLTGDNVATGVQLDIIGKYVGVTRSGLGFTNNIILNDADFLSLIKMAIAENNFGSSLLDIQNFIQTYFPDQMFVFDYQNMRLSYMLTTEVGSQDLIQLFITEGLLPKPMGVQLASIIYVPDVTVFFGYRTYLNPGTINKPYNTYSGGFEADSFYLSYSNAVGA